MATGERPDGDEAARSFQPGMVLDGRDRLERRLAEGGMGSVWVGRQIALEREVAVKALRVGSGQLRARLRGEALALAAVHHPSIVDVYDYAETADGSPYLNAQGQPQNPRLYQGAAGEGIAVDRNGNVFAGEGPNSMRHAGGPWTKYSVAAGGM